MARNVIISCCLLALLVVSVRPAPDDKLDQIDVDGVLSNERLLHSYIECVLGDDDGKCTSEGKDIKNRLPQVVSTGCGDCSPTQLERATKVLKHLTEKHPAEWAKLKAKYDPTGEFTKKHGATWKQRGVDF